MGNARIALELHIRVEKLHKDLAGSLFPIPQTLNP